MKFSLLLVLTTTTLATAAFSFVDRRPSDVAVEIVADPEVAPAEASLVPWSRPPGPARIAIQAGHWRAFEAPDEQAGLRNNGTRGGGKLEWEVNLAIAERAAGMLRERGYLVDVLPTTIPPSYWADVFVAVHADGSSSSATSGYRAAAPGRDATGRAQVLADVLERTYEGATGMARYPNVTRRMRYYYAFNWRRYRHSLHPMTTAAIIETGFLTSPRDRRIIVDNPDVPARGIADGIMLYLETAGYLPEIAIPRHGPPNQRIEPVAF